jgi:hypothetical protein
MCISESLHSHKETHAVQNHPIECKSTADLTRVLPAMTPTTRPLAKRPTTTSHVATGLDTCWLDSTTKKSTLSLQHA